MKQVKIVLNPLRSPIAALLLSVVFGPVGLIYASIVGAIVMIFLFLIGYGTNSFYALGLVWLLSCFWSVMAVNRYNRCLMRKLAIKTASDRFAQDIHDDSAD